MPRGALPIEYRLEVIDGYMRPIFDGMEPELNTLMWELLLPFPVSAAALLEEISRVEGSDVGEWIFESPETRITCTPKTLVLEDRQSEAQGSKPIRIKIPLKKATRLMRRWLFECAWREQQIREQMAGR